MAEETLAPDDRPVITVSQLNQRARALLEAEPGLQDIWVRGEISNYSGPYRGSGHCYFSLKDEEARVDVVMWRPAFSRLTFEPEEGMEVLARGDTGLYEVRGSFQFIIQEMIPAGEGELAIRFQMLKQQLGEEGLFDEARKRPLPPFPLHVGVVTSREAAAFQDVLNVLRRRSPHVQVVLSHARVQGEGAAEEVARAIQRLNDHASATGELDVLIVTRGGGSMEDLWAFNEEPAVRAVAASRLPVVAGVGHETDWTLVDHAADVRAPTPSAAAEVAAPSREETLEMLEQRERALAGRLEHLLKLRAHQLDALASRPVLTRPEALFAQAWQLTDDLADRLPRAVGHHLERARSRLTSLAERPIFQRPEGLLREPAQALEELSRRLPQAVDLQLERQASGLSQMAATLDALSPLKVLGRGFAAALKDGELVRSIEGVAPGDALDVRVADGTIRTDVTGTEEDEP